MTCFLDRELAPGIIFRYRMTATNLAGQTSGFSNEAFARTGPEPPPAGPGFVFTGGAAEIYINGIDMGATMAGVRIGQELSNVDVYDDKAGDAIKIITSGASVYVETELAETTLDNIYLLYGGQILAQLGTLTTWGDLQGYVWGSLQQLQWTLGQVDESAQAVQVLLRLVEATRPTMRVRIEGLSPQGLYRNYFFWAGAVYSGTEMVLDRNAATRIPVKWKIIPDYTKSGREYGFILDSVDPFDQDEFL